MYYVDFVKWMLGELSPSLVEEYVHFAQWGWMLIFPLGFFGLLFFSCLLDNSKVLSSVFAKFPVCFTFPMKRVIQYGMVILLLY
jgi:hypothetical protein